MNLGSAPPPRQPVPLWKQAVRIAPVFFVLGAAMELFMIKTGFYEIVTRKEAERRLERKQELELFRKQAEEARKARAAAAAQASLAERSGEASAVATDSPPVPPASSDRS
mmetsp:Transcript_5993/g.10264  ORF Transcript_5993/g.10264 Transcript_5993/m.10264 type:complete len:110 (+) Transcript_5993:108-437(+)